MHMREDVSIASTEGHVLKKITHVWTIMKTPNNPIEWSLKEQHSKLSPDWKARLDGSF